jgi:hypothetical protein
MGVSGMTAWLRLLHKLRRRVHRINAYESGLSNRYSRLADIEENPDSDLSAEADRFMFISEHSAGLALQARLRSFPEFIIV